MNKVFCYLCDSKNSHSYIEENGYKLVKCSECGLLYVQNPPLEQDILKSTEIGKYYGEKELNVTLRHHNYKIAEYKKLLNAFGLKSKLTINSWLDMGCGHGEFIEAIIGYYDGKIEIKGSEPNVNKQKSAQKRNLDVTFIDIKNHTNKYDMVSLLDVYSHLYNPPKFIESLKSLLNPKGFLLIQTGDAAEFSAQDQFKPLGLPDHLSFTSENLLRKMLVDLGFTIIEVNKYSYLKFNFITIFKEIAKIFMPGYHSSLKFYFNYDKYSNTNMFVLAQLKD